MLKSFTKKDEACWLKVCFPRKTSLDGRKMESCIEVLKNNIYIAVYIFCKALGPGPSPISNLKLKKDQS